MKITVSVACAENTRAPIGSTQDQCLGLSGEAGRGLPRVAFDLGLDG